MTYAIGGLVIAVIIVGICLWGYGLIVLCEEAGPFVGIPAVVCSIALLVGVGLWAFDRYADDDTHRHQWDGGSGPDTRCHYEVDHRIIPAGKVMVPTDQLVTVCVDVEGHR